MPGIADGYGLFGGRSTIWYQTPCNSSVTKDSPNEAIALLKSTKSLAVSQLSDFLKQGTSIRFNWLRNRTDFNLNFYAYSIAAKTALSTPQTIIDKNVLKASVRHLTARFV